MGKKKPSRARPVDFERSIDKLDREIVEILNQRAKLTIEAIQANPSGEEVHELARDRELADRWVGLSKGPIEPEMLRTFAQDLVRSTRAMVRRPRVVYLGPEYSYSHLAAVEYFGPSVELLPVNSIKAVFDELSTGKVAHGVVPIENSTDGRIVDTLDMFARRPVGIRGEVQLRIHHHLLGNCPRSQVMEIYSKPQAISQCREWIERNMSHARVVEMASTSVAAKVAAEKPGAAAIASMQAARKYGLSVIDSHIEDNKHNMTRFAILGGEESKRTGKDKTAIMFELAHRPGALADALAALKKTRLNMTWIESFPIAGGRAEYLFFCEIEGHRSESRVAKALSLLQRRCVRLETLGSYPRSEPVG